MIIEKVFKFNCAHIEEVILALAEEINKGYRIVSMSQIPFETTCHSHPAYAPGMEITLRNKESEYS